MKSTIRKQIESILGEKKEYTGFVDATSKQKTKFRMKLVTRRIPSESQINRIKELPHVLDAKYETAPHGYYPGVSIHFDCKPSQI